jgi:hypothetical protein
VVRVHSASAKSGCCVDPTRRLTSVDQVGEAGEKMRRLRSDRPAASTGQGCRRQRPPAGTAASPETGGTPPSASALRSASARCCVVSGADGGAGVRQRVEDRPAAPRERRPLRCPHLVRGGGDAVGMKEHARATLAQHQHLPVAVAQPVVRRPLRTAPPRQARLQPRLVHGEPLGQARCATHSHTRARPTPMRTGGQALLRRRR